MYPEAVLRRMRRTFFGDTERISANLEIFLSSRCHTFEILYCPASLIDPRCKASTECAPAGKGAMKGFLPTEKGFFSVVRNSDLEPGRGLALNVRRNPTQTISLRTA